MDANIKALADKLAVKAIEKQSLDLTALQQHVSGALANPHLRNSLMGAGAGGLLGLVTGGEDKKRKALHYALLGGLGGAGLTAGKNMLDKAMAPPPKELQAPVASTLGPVAKGVGIAGGAAAGTAGLAAAGLAGRHARAALARSSPVARQLIRSLSRMPGPAKLLAPLAGGALAYGMMSGGSK
jgi:hypothetical protein